MWNFDPIPAEPRNCVTVAQFPSPQVLAKTAGWCWSFHPKVSALTRARLFPAALFLRTAEWHLGVGSSCTQLHRLSPIPFPFMPLRTLLHLPTTQLLYLRSLAHSLRKTTRGGGTPAVTEAQNDLHHRQHEPVPQPAALPSSTGHGSQDTVHASPGCRLLRRMLRFGVP